MPFQREMEEAAASFPPFSKPPLTPLARTRESSLTSSCVTISKGSIRITTSPHRSNGGSSRVSGTRDRDFISRLLNERKKKRENERERERERERL